MHTVHYIGYYRDKKYEKAFTGNIPAMLKMRYVVKCLEKCNKNTNIISLCAPASNSLDNANYKKMKLSDLTSIKYIRLLAEKNKYIKYINHIFRQIYVLLYGLFTVKKYDTILLYHSPTITKLLHIIKKFRKNIKIVIELEEVYGYSALGVQKSVVNELKNLHNMDAYIMVNDYIEKSLGLSDDIKKTVLYGVYNTASQVESKNIFSSDYKHIVYAGTIELNKRGALTAVNSAEFLSDDYQMHILGFGNEKSVKLLKEKINKINDSAKYEKVVFHGYKQGYELSEIYFNCDIGLSTYVLLPEFCCHTFPSKIVSYISHGLTIVSYYADSFAMSKFNKYFSFYHEDTPKAVAEAIMAVKEKKDIKEHQELIFQLEKDFIEWLKKEV